MNNLDLTGAKQTLNLVFTGVPEWHAGEENYEITTPQPLSSLTQGDISAGYLYNHLMVGQKRDWKTARISQASWTHNGATLDADPNGDMIRRIGRSQGPFDYSPGSGLIMKAFRMPAYLQRTVDKSKDGPAEYMGAAFNTFPYCQKYGVFSINWKVPKGHGLWPAFWLLPFNKSWPPEIDAVEILGHATDTIIATCHWKDAQGGHKFQPQLFKPGFDMASRYCEITIDWHPEGVIWYCDGKYLGEWKGKISDPCYIICNLAVGTPTSWGGQGAVHPDTVFPAELKVKSIKAWQRDKYIGAP